MLQVLDGAAVRQWAELSVTALAGDREAIDRINVYPVADNDTGTNLLQTMRSAVAAIEAGPETPESVLGALARGALTGARGNSGMLLSQMLRGLAEEPGGVSAMDGSMIRGALERAESRAIRAVAEPRAGTLLSVLHSAVQAAREAGTDLPTVVRAATEASVRALDETTRQLPVLQAAGVVDAGGRGLVVLLDMLHAVVRDGERLAAEQRLSLQGRSESAPVTSPGHESAYSYEVMYLLSGACSDDTVRLQETLSRLGDCVSVVGDGSVACAGSGIGADGESWVDGESWAVHVHCDDIGAAIESGIELGRVHGIRVTRFADQVPGAVSTPIPTDNPTDNPAGTAGTRAVVPRRAAGTGAVVLACARSEALAALFRSEGACVLMIDSHRAPGTDDMIAAIIATKAAHVLVLPNDEMLMPIAEEAAGRAVGDGREVVVVPSASPVQGLAALAVHDPDRRTAEDAVALAEAAAATRRGELIVTVRQALTWVGYCQPGDVLGLADGEVVLIGDNLVTAACELVDRMLTAGGELVTALVDDHAPDSLAEEFARHLHRAHPEVEFHCHRAGNLAAVLLLGVE
ncbi:DAK2 domain-containing protein [Haloactinomyces albus]|uniref:Dihydroxyacetone kinase-like predicted kinase n=1 Tax=Haloactinomyces albus TaxID=1352928 RepID=A0AAE3ZBR7_9ACTN|nr:DAK2 domain-containing protein [Haloactinomyces albus]MDR7300751.1 dihydroxyacetone kinase-like predicted kinase [Haloactinomyces albus]